MAKISKYCINIPWTSQSDLWWNDMCADVFEVFGLPGGRYESEPSTECLKFYFKNEKDFLLCQILVSDKQC